MQFRELKKLKASRFLCFIIKSAFLICCWVEMGVEPGLRATEAAALPLLREKAANFKSF